MVSPAEPERDERVLSSFELLVRAADVAQAEAARPAVELLPAGARRNAALGQLALLAARPAAGTFRVADPELSAIEILVVLDGLGAHANTDRAGQPPAVADLAVTTAERVLDLPAGTVTALMTKDGQP
jgi:hypothetical protein